MKLPIIDICWRVVAGGISCVTVALTFANFQVARQFLFLVDDLEDFFIVAVPFLWTLIASAASIGVVLLPSRHASAQAALRGAFVGASVYLPLMWSAVFSIGGPGDGLHYWISVFLPTLFIGLPLVVLGVAGGGFASLIRFNHPTDKLKRIIDDCYT